MSAFIPPRGLLVDLDGVVYHGDRVIPDAPAFFRFLRKRGIPFLMTTNNSTLRPRQYVEKLARMDIEVTDDEVLGSAGATASYVAQHAWPGARVFAIGEEGLLSALEEAGLVLAESDVEYVVVGLDRRLDYRQLTLAVRLVAGGARFIGSNPDTTLPLEDGIIPGAGAFHAAITAATGVRPTVIGKPESTMLLLGCERLSLAPKEVAIIGDRLDTDIVGGLRAGLRTLLVLTGVSTLEDVDRSDVKPEAVFADLSELQAALGG
ncbi:MAG: HAD family hydrolase [Chloroflexi bacterium]|nr:HAD family hydrolase [Chloroflexota bacterium]